MRLVASIALAILLAPLTAAQPRSPKLVVLIVVDQMRADYIGRFERDWNGGFTRLVRDGAVFTNAAYPYLTTVTCAGHATMATGTFPRSHGIIQNTWWDRTRGASMTCTEDPSVTGVSYRTPAKIGDSAWRLERPTFTDLYRTVGHGHVVTLALKDRSAIMLAGHGGDAVTWVSDPIESWTTSSAFAKSPVPAVKTFVDANPITGDFGKTWTLALPESQYPEPDDVKSEAPPEGWTRTFPHVLNGAHDAPDASYLAQWERSPFANDYVGRFAIALVDAFALGKHETTDVLAVSFSTPDLVGHHFGPDSREERDVYVRLDRTIGALLDHLDRTVGRGQWTAALSADHGIMSIPDLQMAAGKDAGRLSNATIKAALDARLKTALGGDGPYVAQANTNDVYFAPGVYDTLKAAPALLESVVQTVRDVPGVARVFRGEELGEPSPSDALQRAAALSYFRGRSGDLVIAPKPGWMFVTAGNSTTHGNAVAEDQHVPLILFGAGIKPGRYTEPVTPADIAPTLAAIGGLTMSKIDGHVLRAALLH